MNDGRVGLEGYLWNVEKASGRGYGFRVDFAERCGKLKARSELMGSNEVRTRGPANVQHSHNHPTGTTLYSSKDATPCNRNF